MKNRSLLALVLAHALLVSVAGQSPSSATQTPSQKREGVPDKDDVVRITSNLVQVDAVVTDKKGQPVTDLRPEEFEIYEDNRPQKITNFSFVSVEPGAQPAGVPAPESATAHAHAGEAVAPVPPVRLRPEEVRRTFALVVDDLGLSFESMHFVRAALRKFVDEQMQPGDLVAIIRTGAGVGALQQFTSDKRLLYAAIEREKWNSRGRSGIAAFSPIQDSPLDTFNKMPQGDGSPAPLNPGTKTDLEKDVRQRQSDFSDQIFSVGTLGALNYIIRGLRTLPGRKSVVLMSETMNLFDSKGEGNYRTIQALRRLTDLANRASVVIYTIDPRGLPPINLTAADNTTGLVTLDDGTITRVNTGPGLMQALMDKTTD